MSFFVLYYFAAQFIFFSGNGKKKMQEKGLFKKNYIKSFAIHNYFEWERLTLAQILCHLSFQFW